MNRLNLGQFSRGRKRQRRSGQTLVEYALLLAYISVVAIQVLDTISLYTTEALIQADLGLLIAQVHNPNLPPAEDKAQELAAVLNFLANYNYGHFDSDQQAKIFTDCYERMANVIAST